MDMKIVSLFIACFISMVVAQGRRGWGGPPPGGPGGPFGRFGPPPGGPGGPPGGPKGPPPSMLPNCTEYENEIHDEVHEMMENGEGGPDNCESGDHPVCRYNDMMNAKTTKDIVPSEACYRQALEFYSRGTTESRSG